jgi:crotonobetainyl-CoA:carnitine CoA-transferase CaiB-like acyl-CoA transferase
MRRFAFPAPVRVAVAAGNRSTRYAGRWLQQIGVEVVAPGEGEAEVVAGGQRGPDHLPEVVLWDYQVGRHGTGYQASAVSGVSWVIGLPGRPPIGLAAEIPEKWCGLIGATLALSSLLSRASRPERFEVSAAEVLRAFADQNAGNHLEIAGGWSRNGRKAVEHGGIYPQGFYPCADGFVGVVARSRQDWRAIVAALGDPAWSTSEEMQDPFALAADDSVVDPLLSKSLSAITRDELLERAIETGATIAPVYRVDEISSRGLLRPDAMEPDGMALPFDIEPW